MSLVLIGHGRMGRLVEQYAIAHGCTIAGVVTEETGPGVLTSPNIRNVDVVVDFSAGPAVKHNLRLVAERGWNMVIGTTGWQEDEAECREIVQRTGIGVIASANFSIGMNVFRLVVEEAARRFGAMEDVGAWISRDAPPREEGRPVRHGAYAEARDDGGRVREAHRHVVDARGRVPWHP